VSLIDPNLLQLIGLGSTGDPDVADGVICDGCSTAHWASREPGSS